MSVITNLDHLIANWFMTIQSPGLTKLAIVISFLGDEYVLVGLAILFSGLLLWKQAGHQVRLILVILAGEELTNLALKFLIKRSRPALAPLIPEPRSYSFPSGHAQASLVFYLTALYLIFYFTPNPKLRRLGLILCPTMILLTGLSRIYLGVHWFTDVVGGYLAGLIWLGFVYFKLAKLAFFQPHQPNS